MRIAKVLARREYLALAIFMKFLEEIMSIHGLVE